MQQPDVQLDQRLDHGEDLEDSCQPDRMRGKMET